MNWLAHLCLSDPTPAHRMGNLLADFLRPAEVLKLPPELLPGIEHHRRIDAITDRHPVFRRGLQRFPPPWRRIAPVLLDLFHDHFLSVEWNQHSDIPLNPFVANVHREVAEFLPVIPRVAHEPLNRLCEEEWLLSYQDLPGMATTLQRVSKRFRRPIDLVPALEVLRTGYDGFQTDFRELFPLLRVTVRNESIPLWSEPSAGKNEQ